MEVETGKRSDMEVYFPLFKVMKRLKKKQPKSDLCVITNAGDMQGAKLI